MCKGREDGEGIQRGATLGNGNMPPMMEAGGGKVTVAAGVPVRPSMVPLLLKAKSPVGKLLLMLYFPARGTWACLLTFPMKLF